MSFLRQWGAFLSGGLRFRLHHVLLLVFLYAAGMCATLMLASALESDQVVAFALIWLFTLVPFWCSGLGYALLNPTEQPQKQRRVFGIMMALGFALGLVLNTMTIVLARLMH